MLDKQSTDGPHKYSCVMLDFPSDLQKRVVAWAKKNIPESDLVGDGYETISHVTLLYGIHSNHLAEVQDSFPKGPIDVELGAVRRFNTDPDHDVLYIEVLGDGLHAAHEVLKKLPNSDTHPDEYKPHMTLAYVKKKACPDLDGQEPFAGRSEALTDLVWSPAKEGEKQHISLSKKAGMGGWLMKKKAEGENEPQKFLVNIPGVIKTWTVAHSNAQAVAYALQQAFTTRNSFWHSGKLYEGELGLKALIDDILADPGFFDYVQALPGLPSQPFEMSLPTAQPQMQAQPPVQPVAPTQPTPVAGMNGWLKQASLIREAFVLMVANRPYEVIPVYSSDLATLDHYDVRDEMNNPVMNIPAGAQLSNAEIEQEIFNGLGSSSPSAV